MKTGEKDRLAVIDHLQETLIGPVGGTHEIIQGSPLLRYMMGILFARKTPASQAADDVVASADDEGEIEPSAGEDALQDERLSMTSEQLPSAVGISIKVSDDEEIDCEIEGARYIQVSPSSAEALLRFNHQRPECDEYIRIVSQLHSKPFEKAIKELNVLSSERSKAVWMRIPLGELSISTRLRLSRRNPVASLNEAGIELRAVWRSKSDGTAIVTISLINKLEAGETIDPSLCIYQCGLICSTTRGSIFPYPMADSAGRRSGEDREIEFLYRMATPFARGHGAAADWQLDDAGHCAQARVSFLPRAKVPQATFELSQPDLDERIFSIGFLSSLENKAEAIAGFHKLASSYESWISEEASEAEEKDIDVGRQLASRATAWARRIREGIRTLEDESTYAWKAFVLANSAMAMQMEFLAQTRSGPFPKTSTRQVPSFDSRTSRSRWRPFQLAFALSQISSLVEDACPDRATADVIWFPTGGGKTEAYLFISAFELVRRRLCWGDQDSGTAIFSRYTLRMLTAQQFERTSALFAALEIIRRESPGKLGKRPFSLGLWAGGSLTPNRWQHAFERLHEALGRENDRVNPFILSACPGCGTDLFPQIGGLEDVGVYSSETDFYFRCPSSACAFHERIPVNVVDDSLYENPPSMLIGTIDKFADLAWRDSPKAFFWGRDGASIPPTLFIQDELHLISGPLGTIDATYEHAIQAIITSKGYAAPKIIASTATIRNAREQIKALYGKECSVFPSPINTWDSAYFFSTDHVAPGRIYIGAMAQGYIKPVVAMTWAAAALLQAPVEVPLSASSLNGYWTLVVYHNSLRELGKTVSAATQEVADRIKAICRPAFSPRTIDQVLELSSNGSKNLAASIQDLQRDHTESQTAVDIVPCTSIISVGVDISRLGIMLINGQPKTTSEYIQASSRVGRSADIPGLVVALYSAYKPRDRSHYEDFRSYHESLYRFVEPTSVTPFSPEALQRTLHAALVSLVRHASAWSGNSSAGSVDIRATSFTDLTSALLSISSAASDADEIVTFKQLLNEHLETWDALVQLCGSNLRYSNDRSRQFSSLLREFSDPPSMGKWPTLRSMRHVDQEIEMTPFIAK